MGNHQTVRSETPAFQPQEWEIVPPSQLQEQHQEFGRICVLKHKVTGESIDQYQMVWPNEDDYIYYLHSFNWRSNQQCIVSSKFIQLLSTDTLSIDIPFCSQVYSANIYIEHILTRLSQISDIPYPDNLYILMEALEGYQKLYEFSSDFTVEENQICVDAEGNIKVWVSSYLARNYPDDEPSSVPHTPSHDKMVRDIVRIITSNTDEDSEPKNFPFKNYFAQAADKKTLTFNDAKVIVNEYANSTETIIPSRFESIFWIYGDSQNMIDQNVEQVPTQSHPYASGVTEQGLNQPTFYQLQANQANQVNQVNQNNPIRPVFSHSGGVNQARNQSIYSYLTNANQPRQIQPLRYAPQNSPIQSSNPHSALNNFPNSVNYSLQSGQNQMTRSPPQLQRGINSYIQNNQSALHNFQHFQPSFSQLIPVMHRTGSNPYPIQIIKKNSNVRFAGSQNSNQRQLFGMYPQSQIQPGSNKAYLRNLLYNINPGNQENFEANRKHLNHKKEPEFQLSQVSREIVSIDELPNQLSFHHQNEKPFQRVVVPEITQKNKNNGFEEKLQKQSSSFEVEQQMEKIRIPNVTLKSVSGSSPRNQGEKFPNENIKHSYKNSIGNQSWSIGNNSSEQTRIYLTDGHSRAEEEYKKQPTYEKTLQNKSSSIKVQKIIYYSSLDQEAEIDEQIAADLLKLIA